MSTSLSDLLDKPLPNSRQPSPEPQESPVAGETPKPAEQQTEQPPAATPAPAADGQQQTGEQPGATPAPDPKAAEGDPVKAFQKAAEDERRKRQGLEATVEELKRHLEEVKRQQQAQPQQTQPPEYLDPEGSQHLQKQFMTALQEQQEINFQARTAQSQEIMRWRHEDYNEIEQVFIQAANADPSLWVKLREHHMPAQYAYQTGKSMKALNEIGSDPDAYSKRLKEEIRADLMKEMQAQQPTPQPQPSPQPSAPTPPPSLVAVPSVGSNTPNSWQGPSSLEALLSQPLRGGRR